MMVKENEKLKQTIAYLLKQCEPAFADVKEDTLQSEESCSSVRQKRF